jgi:group I intron endonuclease
MARRKNGPKKFNKNSAVISSLKRSFSRSPIVKEMLDDVRSEEVWYKKDGTPAAKPRVLFECKKCGSKEMRKNVQCDHVFPVVPVEIPSKHMSLAMMCHRLFVGKDKLQILCKPCHSKKSKKENDLRKEWRKKEKHIVYVTQNMVNMKMYVGVHSCVDLDDGYLGSGTLLKKAIKKYGEENFTREVLYVFSNKKDAYKKEAEIVQEFIVESEEFYNLTKGGRCLDMNWDIREKISQSRKGKTTGKDNPMYGKTHSEEVRKKIADREYATGKDHFAAKKIICVETKEVFNSITEAGIAHITRAIKNGTSAGGYHWEYLENYNENKKYKKIKHAKRKVLCIDNNKIFDTLIEAARSVGKKSGSKIGDVCRGKRKTAYGLKWRFVE